MSVEQIWLRNVLVVMQLYCDQWLRGMLLFVKPNGGIEELI